FECRLAAVFSLCRLAEGSAPGGLRERYETSQCGKKDVEVVRLSLRMTTSEATILLVDDSKEDRVLMVQALADAGLACKIDEVSDAEEAESYFLRKLGEGSVPQLIILDL